MVARKLEVFELSEMFFVLCQKPSPDLIYCAGWN